MEHFSRAITTIEHLNEFLEELLPHARAEHVKSILVQFFVGNPDASWIKEVTGQIQNTLPKAVIVSITSAGEITEGRVSLESNTLSFTCLAESDLHASGHYCIKGEEYATGEDIARQLLDIPHLKGVLLLAPPTKIDCARLLDGINKHLPNTPVFGGIAAMTDTPNHPMISLNSVPCDIVAVGLIGASLHIHYQTFLGWKALGPSMILTKVEGFDIWSIDNKPALDVYQKYLGIESDDDIFLLEFPLLIDRQGMTLARNPIASNEAGHVSLVADVYSGEVARMGYLDVDMVIENVHKIYSQVEAFEAEAVFLYSCICRRFALQQDAELETLPFQEIAPTAGFFTYGEFCRTEGQLQLFNSSQVAVAMREGDLKGKRHNTSQQSVLSQMDNHRVRHIRITGRLFHFISALTEEVEEANRVLHHQASHDALTGALNRHALNADLHKEVIRSKRYNHNLSVIIFDIDHFKHFNDEFGHLAGDHVLKIIADTVGGFLRSSDSLYRFGGEEFLLLLPETTTSGAMVLVERIRLAIQALRLHHEGNLLPTITASFGVAGYPEHGNDGPTVVNAADAALYQSKRLGRNRASRATLDN